MRADFETRCLAYPELTDAVQDRYLLAPMTARQLTMAITEPAKRIGSSVDGDLVKVLLRETSMQLCKLAGSVLKKRGEDDASQLPVVHQPAQQGARIKNGSGRCCNGLRLLSFGVSNFFLYGLLQWQPTFFIRSYGLRTGEIGSWFAIAYGVCGLLGNYYGGALASRIAGASVHLEEGEGHLSIGLGALDRMLDELVSAGNTG